VSFKSEGMGVTLDGIAVGFIVDRVSERFWSRGIKNHLINASAISGPELQGRREALGRRDSDPWKRKTYPDTVHMGDGAISHQATTRSTTIRRRCFTTS